MVGAIEFSGVKKSFRRPDGEIVHALNGVDLKIEQGDFVCLIGPSGCGKSTMLRLLAGLDQPTEGAVYLDGEKITRPNYDRGLVFQDPNLFPWLNIYDNISFGLRARHIFKQKRDSVREFMDLVGLTGFEKSYPHQLSGGMCQRASLARALIGHPKALLLDEPLGALDAFTRMNMQDELLRIKAEQNMTMVTQLKILDPLINFLHVILRLFFPGILQNFILVSLMLSFQDFQRLQLFFCQIFPFFPEQPSLLQPFPISVFLFQNRITFSLDNRIHTFLFLPRFLGNLQFFIGYLLS